MLPSLSLSLTPASRGCGVLMVAGSHQEGRFLLLSTLSHLSFLSSLIAPSPALFSSPVSLSISPRLSFSLPPSFLRAPISKAGFELTIHVAKDDLELPILLTPL